MVSVKKLMLSAAVLAGALGLGANKAQAAQFGIYVSGGPVAYVPPCPGPGYVWVNGYWNGGYWVPGRWDFVGVRRPAPVVGFGYYRGDRDGYYYHRSDRDRDDYRRHDWDRDRHLDRDRDRDRDRDHFRR
jgi:hypothetical protein